MIAWATHSAASSGSVTLGLLWREIVCCELNSGERQVKLGVQRGPLRPAML
jgi:hypothetical protein